MRCAAAMVGVAVCAGLASADAPRVLLIGPDALTREFQSVLERVGVATDAWTSAEALTAADLSVYAGVAICSQMRETPTALSVEQAQALLRFVREGGRAYAEYVQFPDGALQGWRFGAEPALNRFERLAVMQDRLLGTRLMRDDLLEEHNAYLLDMTPPDSAESLLKFGLFMGTYAVDWDIKEQPTSFTIVVDLGAEYALGSAEQWYGGLDPDYVPDVVQLSLAGEDGKYEDAGELGMDDLNDLKGVFNLDGQRARYVRIYVEKQRSSRPIGDFLVLGGIEVYDTAGTNVALNRPYTLAQKQGEPKQVENGALTRGEKPRAWADDRSHLFSAPERRGLNDYKWEGLVSWPCGAGRLYLAATPLSVFRTNSYRLTSRWEALIRGAAFALLPDAAREEARARWLPLEAHTTPRRWVEPGAEVALHVQTAPGSTVEADGISVGPFEEREPGRYVARVSPEEGEYAIRVTVRNAKAANEAVVPLSVAPRAAMYRRALDRNMAWFLNSGTMPNPDGSEGIRSTVEIGALFAGEAEDLPSAFRADCQAMCGRAFYLYGDLTGDATWRRRGERLADFLLQYQFTDPSSPTYGAFRWLREGNDAIYPQDDNNRNAEFLTWLYERTGNEEYLESALAAVEFGRDTSREDGTLSYWVADPGQVEENGRFWLRTVNAFSNVTDWCLFRNHYAYRATGDARYMQSLRDLTRIYGTATVTPGAMATLPDAGQYERLGPRGLAIAIAHLPESDPLRQALIARHREQCEEFLAREDVQRYGSAAPDHDITETDIGYAYINDCAIHTRAGEPLTDQLYATSSAALRLWEAYCADPNPVARAALESSLDYLVRIQCEHADPRLDGCWMRAFDMEHWEYYGTRYDPNYGAYHAYTGWMNSIIAAALASCLLDENPLEADPSRHAAAQKVLARVRAARTPEYLLEQNRLRGVPMTADPAPDAGSRDVATITDGVIEGWHADGLSAGWTVPEGSDAFTVTLDGTLDEAVLCSRLSVRVGGLNPTRSPERISLFLGESADDLSLALEAPLTSADGMNWFSFDERLVRRVRVVLSKRNESDEPAQFFVGEVQLIGLESDQMAR